MTDMIRSIVTNDYVLRDTDIAEAVIFALGTPENVEVCTDEMAIHKTIHTVTSLSKIIVTYFNP
jgi:NADP-dependent 3-hydroxy acid dehydrogenase YdfG